jgi:hypothetical protein
MRYISFEYLADSLDGESVVVEDRVYSVERTSYGLELSGSTFDFLILEANNKRVRIVEDEPTNEVGLMEGERGDNPIRVAKINFVNIKE